MTARIWRSEEMQLVQLFIQYDAAHDTIEELGNIGMIQFRDLNPDDTAFQRNFVNEVKRCDDMERRVQWLHAQIDAEIKESEDRELELAMEVVPGDEAAAGLSMDRLEAQLEQEEAELRDANNNTEMLERNKNELMELRHVLEKDTAFFQEAGDFGGAGAGGGAREASPLLADEADPESGAFVRMGNLGFLTGVISEDKFNSFERVLWRATRGNLFLKSTPVDEPIIDPQTREVEHKRVFIIFFQGQRIEAKIRKICEAFRANLYPCPESHQERNDLLMQVHTRLDDLNMVLGHGRDQRLQVLRRVASDLPAWEAKVLKEKSIYHTMNLFNYDHGRKCLIAEGWCPTSATTEIQLALRRATERSGAMVPSILSIVQANDSPPTHFNTDGFATAFQEIVDAYGVARYQEINPATFTIATFPFLFAVMYGDVGHGFLMLLASSALLYFNERIRASGPQNEIVVMVLDGRWLLFLMSLGAIYSGALYNEVFSIPMDVFGSQWVKVPDNTYLQPNGTAYPFGIDPAWKSSSNVLLFENNLKMKMSVILGVTQMTMGVMLHLFNSVYFRKPYDIFFEWAPQIVFILAYFGYMCLLIFVKWSTNYQPHDTGRAPPILETLINMILKVGNSIEPDDQLLGPSQHTIQIILVLLMVISMPLMLLPKPLLLRRDANRGHHDPEHGEHFDFGEVFIHQIIHTIEYILGCISNTASYLRLWALSLAHSELSIVFWEQIYGNVFSKAEGGAGLVFMVVAFAVWGGATVAVLLIMESLSAFLHALRLHWVEFQNKFYRGDGYLFVPFSFTTILKEAADNAQLVEA